ncbi:MAG: amidase [Alphaproteobacteria bacterium]|nr:MAG: amidase [Alphaproteobacteria bacterium]
MSRDLALMPATDLLAAYRAKTLSPVEATRAALDRIAALDSRHNAFCLVDEAGALAAARESEGRWHRGEPRGLVDGVPTTIKDLLLSKGWPTLRGSRTVGRDQDWSEDAPSVARLREHGAVFLGKTTTPEFGWKGVTDNPLTGITRNPWDPEKTPGGSSGGAAVAAALGMGALHLGTDGGGSIRIPAAFSGIFGLKQTFGLVPAYPLSPFGTVAHVGPMTRTVADAALMLTVLAGPDARDWYALPPDGRDYRVGLDLGLKGRRIAWCPRLGGAVVDPEVAAITADAAKVLAELGAELEEADPGLGNSRETFVRHWYPGAANAIRALGPEERTLMDPGLVAIAEAGARLPLMDYLAAVRERETMGQRMNLFHRDWDLLVTPAMPIAAFEAGRETPAGSANERWVDWTPFTYPFNLTRQPAAVVPCGFTAAGLPVALQIVGPLYGDAAVLQAAHAFELARPIALPHF